LPEQREPNIDDVLVARQHQTFVAAGATGAVDGADGGLVFRDGDALDALNRPQVEMQARGTDLNRLTETELHAQLLGIDRVEGVHQPEHDQRKRNAHKGPATAGHAALELIAATSQNFLEIGGSTTPARATAPTAATAARRLTPGTASIAVPS